MQPAVIVKALGKQFLRYHVGKPVTFHEAVLSGWRKMRATDRFWALREVNFTLLPGQMLGIVGRNGAGKSTLLQLIGGVIKSDEGSIEKNGRIGALLQLGGTFHSDLTGLENVRIGGVVAGLTRAQLAKRLDSIVHFAEAESYIDNPVRTYSSGMKMRLAFSIAVHTDPNILLVDEHLSVGDCTFEGKCLQRITTLKDNGCAILLVSHNTQKIKDHCDTTVWLEDGRVRAHGQTNEVVCQYLSGKKAEPGEISFDPLESGVIAANCSQPQAAHSITDGNAREDRLAYSHQGPAADVHL